MKSPKSGSRTSANRRKADRITSPEASAAPTAGSVLLEKLQAIGFIGMWKNRTDIEDSTEFVQHLREQIDARADGTMPVE